MASSQPVFYKQATLSSTSAPSQIFGPHSIPRMRTPQTDESVAPLCIPYPVGYTPEASASAWAEESERIKQRVMEAKAEAYARRNRRVVYEEAQERKTSVSTGQRTVVRAAGGEVWTDSTLLQWDKGKFFCLSNF